MTDEVRRAALLERVNALRTHAGSFGSRDAVLSFSAEVALLASDVLEFSSADRLPGRAVQALAAIERWPQEWEELAPIREEARALLAEIPPGAELQPFSPQLRGLARGHPSDGLVILSLVAALTELLGRKQRPLRSAGSPFARNAPVLGARLQLAPGDEERAEALARDVKTLGKAHRLVYEVDDGGAFAASFARQLRNLTEAVYAFAGLDTLPASVAETLAAAERWFGSGQAPGYYREMHATFAYCELLEVTGGWRAGWEEQRVRFEALQARYPDLPYSEHEVDQLLSDLFQVVRARMFGDGA